MDELANPQQLTLLIRLHRQLGLRINSVELAQLTKWQAADRISMLRGQPSATPEELDEALLGILSERESLFGEVEAPPAPEEPEEEAPKPRRRRRS